MPEPLALYIHWPFCKSKCPYCDFNSHVREAVDHAAWRVALLKEMAYMAEKLPAHGLQSIFFGGGTPSLMEPETVASLIETAGEYWPFEPDIEITLEANPTSVETGRLQAFRAAGVNRVSLGVQALGAKPLEFLGRTHSENEALKAVETAASIFPRYSFDLIYARPGQTAEEWEQELRRALPYARGHLSLYQLTIEENTAFFHDHARGKFRLPEDRLAADMYRVTQEVMEAAGLPAYEVSNHAAPGEESRHNLSYWRGQPYVGIGPGAHGRVRMQGAWHATQTLKSPERWLSQVERDGHGLEICTKLNAEERREEQAIMRLRLTGRVARDEWEAMGLAWPQAKLALYAQNGLADVAGDSFALTLQGRLLLNTLTADLLG